MKTKEDIKTILDELLHKLIELREKIEGGDYKMSVLDWAAKKRIDTGICWYLDIKYDIDVMKHGTMLFGTSGFLGGYTNEEVVLGICDLTPLNLRIQWLQNVTDEQIDILIKCANK